MKKFSVMLILAFGIALVGCVPPGSGDGDSSTNTGLTLYASYTGTEDIKAVTVAGDYLYAAAGYDGIIIFSISNTNSITKITGASFETNWPMNDISILNDSGTIYAFTAMGNTDGTGGLAIFDVTDPTNITEVAVSNISGKNGNAIEVISSTAVVVADEYGGSDTYTIDLGAKTITPGDNNGLNTKPGVAVAANATYAYIAAKDGGVYVMALASFTTISAQISSSLSIANSVDISGNTLVVGDRMGGVMLYNVSTANQPKFKGSYNTPGDAFDVVVNGTDVFVADGFNGVIWLDITSQTEPALKGSYTETGGMAFNIFYSTDTGQYVYAAYGPKGIRIFKKVS